MNDIKRGIESVNSGHLEVNVLQEFAEKIKRSVQYGRNSKLDIDILHVLCDEQIVQQLETLVIENIDLTDLDISKVTSKVEKRLSLRNVTMSVDVFGSVKCKHLSIVNMVLSDNVSTSLGQCVNNNITELELDSVEFNFRLFSACVTDQSKCNYIYCNLATAEMYRDDFKYFCKQSRTWSITYDENWGFLIERT